MQPRSRRLRRALGIVAVVVLVLVLLLRTDRAGELVCAQVREQIPKIIDGEVSIGRCAIDPLTLSVELQQIGVTLAPSTEPMVTADKASVSLRGVFFGGISLQAIELIRPKIDIALPETTPPSTEPKGCPLTELKRIRISQLKVTDGTVIVRHPSGLKVRIDGLQIDASLDRREAIVHVEARSGEVLVRDRTIHLGKLTLETTLEPEAQSLELQRAEVNVEGTTVTASGTIDSLCNAQPSLDLSAQAYVPMETLPRLGLPLPNASGQVLARVTVGGHPDNISLRGELQGTQLTIGKFAPGDFSARVLWSGKKVSLEELVTTSGDGDIRVSAELTLEKDFPITAKVETNDASFARIMARAGVTGSWVEFPASVKGTITGHLMPSPVLGGDVDFHTGKFTLATRAWDAPKDRGIDILAFQQARGKFRLGVTSQGVSFDDLTLTVGANEATRVRGAITIYPATPGLDVNVNVEQIDLSDFGTIVELPWSGIGSAHVEVHGPFKSIVIDGQTAFRDFKFAHYALGVVQSPVHYADDTLSFPALAAQKGQTQYFADLSLLFKKAGLYARATVQLPDGRVEDIVDLLSDLSPSIATLQGGLLTGRISALAAIDCPAAELTGVIATRVRDVKLIDRRLGEADLIARFEAGEALVLEPTIFDGPLGRTALGGSWKFAGPLDFNLAIERGSLAELIDPEAVSKIPVGGTFVAKGNVFGSTDLTRAKLWLSSGEVNWRGAVLGPMHLEAALTGRDFDVDGSLFPGARGSLKLKFDGDWPYEAHLGVDLADLSPFLPATATNVAGRLKGTVDARGPMLKYEKSVAEVRLEEVSIARGEVSASNVEPVSLTWNAGALIVDSLSLRGATTELTAAGRWGPVNVDLKTRGSVDMRLLSSFVDSLERTQGRLDFTAAVAGSVNHPSIAGSASLSDTRFSLKGQDIAVRALSGRADFSESRIIVQDVQGFLNDGRVRTRGDVRLDGLSMKSVELQTDIEDVSIQVLPDVPVTLTGALLLAMKNGGQYQLSGGIDIVKFRYTQPLSLEGLVSNARETSVPSDSKPNEWLRLDVDLRTAGDVRVDNNLARARLAGRLKLTGTNVKPILVGVVETQEGAQATFRGNTYYVQRGLLQFNGLWPTFDLAAQSQVREYLVSVKAFGRFEDPKVSLTSEPPLPETDILSLLTLGVTSRERFNATSGAGLAAEALMSASGLDAQVQRFLTQNVGLRDQQVKLTTSFNEVTGTAEPAVSWESKVLTDNFKLGLIQPVTGKGTRAQAEYRFNQRVSARAQWDNQNQNTSVGNPGVELRFRFEWE